MLLMEHHQRESRQAIGINTSESTAIVRRSNFKYDVAELIFERRFIAENGRCGRAYPLAARGPTVTSRQRWPLAPEVIAAVRARSRGRCARARPENPAPASASTTRGNRRC